MKKNTKKKVIYTCLTGDYNNLIKHKFINKDYDYICFTDIPKLLKKKKIGSWQIKPLAFNKLNNTKNSRWHKLHPHIILSEYDESIWLDGYINIKTSFLFDQIEEKCKNNDILIPIHKDRDCVYDELLAISYYGVENDKNLNKMKSILEKEGMPYNFGMNDASIIYRKHNKDFIIKLMNDWWYYVENITKRDQASWTLVLYKNNVNINDLYLENIRMDIKNYSLEKDSTKNFIYNNFDSESVLYLIILKQIMYKINNIKSKIKNFIYMSSYLKYMEESNLNLTKDFVPFKKYNELTNKSKIKFLAFYLPQYYTFKENDKWHGKGFTEWTNVTTSFPMYTGHYQPHLPYDMGFYSLELVKTFKRQIELAKNYGIYGFVFHYYWFSGKRLMEKPLDIFLENKDLDIQFCLNWPCDNWTKLWDGGNNKILQKCELQENDYRQFLDDLLPYINDKRYIRIDNKPLILFYGYNRFGIEKCRLFIENLREYAKNKYGLDLYIINTLTRENEIINLKNIGFDAGAEFAPNLYVSQLENTTNKELKNKYVNPNFKCNIFDISDFIKTKKFIYNTDFKLFKGVCLPWDNSARKKYTCARIIEGITSNVYLEWLKGCINYTVRNHKDDERYIFINAWNEWGEGCHLEPDLKNGYKYLEVTRRAIEEDF